MPVNHHSPHPRRNLTRNQRDRLLLKAHRLRCFCESSSYLRRPYSPLPARERRFQGVATRLERYVAGIPRHESTLPLITRATQRHIDGETSYLEWIDELRWAGLPARVGHTRLNEADTARRNQNLSRLYPRTGSARM